MSTASAARGAACLTLGLLLAGAAALAAGSSPAQLTPPLSVKWTFSMGAQPSNTTTVVVLEGRVYVSHAGALRCLDARTGGQLWEFRPGEGGVCTSPVVWENLIIVGATDSRLYGLNAADGSLLWSRACAGPPSPDPLIVGNRLFVGAQQMVYSIAPPTGQAKWVCSLTAPATAGPVHSAGMLYFLTQDGAIQSVVAEQGRLRWRSPLSGSPRAFPPIIADRRVIVASGRTIFGIARSGAISWTAELPGGVGGAPTLFEGALYVPCADGHVYRLYPRSGRAFRGAEFVADSPMTAPPLAIGDLVFAGTASGLIYAMDAGTGQVRWAYRCRAPEQTAPEAARFGLYAPLVSADGSLYCLTGMGDLYCFSASAPDPAAPRFAQFEPESGSALPGDTPISIAFSVTDDGSGVDAASVQVTVDGSRVEVEFDASSGVGRANLGPLPDGSHVVRLTARDYRGNVGADEWSFLTDSSLLSAEEALTGTETFGF